MTAHASILARRIPWTEEPSGPRSIGLQRVGPDRSSASHVEPAVQLKYKTVRTDHGENVLSSTFDGVTIRHQMSLLQNVVARPYSPYFMKGVW